MAERTIQLIEDDVRTLKSAFEKLIKARPTSTHPLTKWLVEHAASLRNGYSTTQTGETPHEKHYVQKRMPRPLKVGEKVFYLIPKEAARRAEPLVEVGRLSWRRAQLQREFRRHLVRRRHQGSWPFASRGGLAMEPTDHTANHRDPCKTQNQWKPSLPVN